MSTTDEPWTIGRLLVWTVDYLKKHGAENPRLDAEVLLASARGCKRIDLYAAYGDEADDDLRARFREFVARRAKGEPVAYIVGHKEFYALDFEVTRDVLIPRPETEMLVVALLDQVKRLEAGVLRLETLDSGNAAQSYSVPSTQYPLPQASQALPASLSIADVGTGSGILAICAAKYLSNARITTIDISPAALAVARRNAERHGVADRITFVESDLFSAHSAAPLFDAIVSNPPYVSTAEMASLPADVRDFEPDLALAAGEQGTDVIARLVTQSAERLKPGGALLIEISPMIATAVEALVRENGSFDLGKTLRDPAGHARVIQATRR